MFGMPDQPQTLDNPSPTPNKYKELLRRHAEQTEHTGPDASNQDRLNWLVARQAREDECQVGPDPWYPPTIYPDKIAQILGIEPSRANEVCDRAKLIPHMNDARCERAVRELRAKWDAGETCDLVDLTEASVILRASTPKTRLLLADHGVRPVNASTKPYLYPRADVLALVGNVSTREARAIATTTERELKMEREREITEVRADYESQDSDLHAQVIDLQAQVKALADRRVRLRSERETRIAEIRVEYARRISETDR